MALGEPAQLLGRKQMKSGTVKFRRCPGCGVDEEEHDAGILLRSDQSAYVGFLIWTGGSTAVLRQIFVRSEDRRKGYAGEAVRYWVRNYADLLDSRFGVESPNERTLRLLV